MNKLLPRKRVVTESKILLVDDSRTTRLILRKVCTSLGILQIEEASNGVEGLQKIIAWKPDLVLLDMNMPEMNGLELCNSLSKQNLIDKVNVIMLTAVTNPEFKAKAFNAGVIDFITKPIHMQELLARVLAHLERVFMRRLMEADYLRMQAELREVMLFQHILLPQESMLSDIQKNLGLDVAHYYEPATELAGDYLSVRALSGNRVMLTSIDVSGHGVSAALYAFLIHTLLDEKCINQQTPGAIVETLNDKLQGLMAKGKFATIFLAIIDTVNQRLDYAAGAAPAPFLFSKEKIIRLSTRGHLLGTQKSATYETYSVPFQKGDMLFIYSDALIETASANGEFLEESTIEKLLMANLSKNSSALINNILEAFHMNYS